MVIKYTAQFKRILFIQTPKGQMRVGETENFQQNLDGSLDIVAFIWPQVPKQLRDQIEKNPGIMGMTAETIPVTDHLVFPDGTKFEELDEPCDHAFVPTQNQKGDVDTICLKCWKPKVELVK